MALTSVIAYDISNGDVRARVAAVLSAWGERVQKSVFICTLEPDDLTRVLERVEALIDHGTDIVQVWRQCAACYAQAAAVGCHEPPEEVRYWIL